MAITIEEFESMSDAAQRPAAKRAANADRVRRFLTERSDRAFTVPEIREGSGVPRGSVGVVLARLEDEGRVRHRGEYWTAGHASTDRETRTERPSE